MFTFVDGRFYRGTEGAPVDLTGRAELTRQWTGLSRPEQRYN
ncbi:MAG: hypothetical protein ACRDOO_11620 [Actinomadura sp.]